MASCEIHDAHPHTSHERLNNSLLGAAWRPPYMAPALVRHQAAELASWAFPTGAGHSAAARS
eukprot:scaffold1738_cov73-Phaeocystis_antarctica.AAC.2